MTTPVRDHEHVEPTVAEHRQRAPLRGFGFAMYTWAVARLSLGAIFLWAFFDKLFGLGFATQREDAWINGGSPTFGFLSFGTHGPLVGWYGDMAGNAFVDWMFMVGLLGIGLALTLGIGMRIAVVAGIAQLMLMYSAYLPPEHHPFVDDHLIYSVLLVGILAAGGGRPLGLADWWSRVPLVRRFPILR